jgi:predicted DsbA family dithiol-disulfide isomerase
MGDMSEVEIEVWVDVVCPWCHIGKRRLEHAIADSPQPSEVTVTYRAFELDPHKPAGRGVTVIERLAQRHRAGLDEARAIAERAAIIGRPDGIDMDIDAQVDANSFDAHRLVALGLAQGGPALQGAVLERLFSAHFTEGKSVDEHESLQRLGAEAGLDGRRVAAVLASSDYADRVRADEAEAAELGVTAVPFFVANRQVALTGAHSVEVLGKLITAALEGEPEPAGQSSV